MMFKISCFCSCMSCCRRAMSACKRAKSAAVGASAACASIGEMIASSPAAAARIAEVLGCRFMLAPLLIRQNQAAGEDIVTHRGQLAVFTVVQVLDLDDRVLVDGQTQSARGAPDLGQI